MYQWSSWKMCKAFVWNIIKTTSFSKFNEFANLYMSHGLTFPNGGAVYRCEESLDSSLHLPLMVFVTQVMRCELVFSIIRNGGFLVRVTCYS
jgi:hypothetical protein